jgi:hypothetical protein
VALATMVHLAALSPDVVVSNKECVNIGKFINKCNHSYRIMTYVK